MALKRFDKKLEGMLSAPIFRKKSPEVKAQNNIDLILGKEKKKFQTETKLSEFDQEQIKHETEELKAEIDELKEKLSKVSGPKKDLAEKVEKLEKENESLKAEIDELLSSKEDSDNVDNS